MAGTKIFEIFFVPAMACLGKNCFSVEKFRKCDLTPVQVDFFFFSIEEPISNLVKNNMSWGVRKEKDKKNLIS